MLQGHVEYFLKGAPEKVLEKCTLYFNNGATSPLKEKQKEEYLEEGQSLAETGLRGNLSDTTFLFVE